MVESAHQSTDSSLARAVNQRNVVGGTKKIILFNMESSQIEHDWFVL